MRPAKRLFDLFWASLGLLLIWPVLLVVALLIRLKDGGPVFYRQERVGYRGKPFRIWKFRTMVVAADRRGPPLTTTGDTRITPVGRWLRRFKLDELPQLLNVLAGEMSLVGPRPEVPAYVARYTPEQRRVLELVPGITDVASLEHWDERVIAGATEPERVYLEKVLPEKLWLSQEYGRTATAWSDFLVICKTLRKIGQ
jgi:lipopolysaccharide/colanic/teichoic acid biosynthesis glycosyltransferase